MVEVTEETKASRLRSYAAIFEMPRRGEHVDVTKMSLAAAEALRFQATYLESLYTLVPPKEADAS
jgi:hypothetical protein